MAAPRATAVSVSVQVISANPDVFLDAVDPSGNAYGTPVSNDHDVMRSRDEGQTWTLVYSFPSTYKLWFISALSSGTLLASVDTGSWTIWRSTDEGASWTKVLSLPVTPVFYRMLTPHSIAEGHGYVWIGTYNTGSGATTNFIYRSADDGQTWSVVNTTSTHRHIHGLGFDPANGKLYVLFGDSDGDGIWVSADDGVTLAPLCTSYACVAIDIAFDPSGSYAVFGQDHYGSARYIEKLDLATGTPTTVGDLPYTSFSALRIGGTYLIGTTRESGESTPDPNLHLFASADGAATFSDVLQEPIAYPSGDDNLRVQFVFPNGDVAIQVGGYGTIVGRIAAGAAPPTNIAAPSISGTARQGTQLRTSTGTWTGAPTSYAYQWQRCDAAGAGCSDIAAATGAGYVPAALDVGHTLRVVVTATNDAGSASASSAATAVVTAGSGGNSVLVVVSHPDDEALGFAGIIESALNQGRSVYVAVVTNGDAGTSGSATGYCGAAAGTPATTARLGLTRDGETTAGMDVLGLSRTNDPATTHIFFLGYPDLALSTIASSSTPYTGDATGLHHTYAEDGDGSSATCNGDLHYEQTSAHAQLDASDLNGDLDRLIALTHPTDVYTNAAFDGHPDHAELHQLVVDALGRAGLAVTVHSTLIHPADTGSCMALSAYMWPNPSDPTFKSPLTRFTPTLDVTAPPTPACSSSPTGSSWGSAGAPNELVPVPADMTTTDLASNRKWQAISQYASQIACTVNADGTYPASCGYMRAFVKSKEFFWAEQIIAPQPPVSTGLPVISGSVVVGQVLSGSTGSWTGSPTSYAYEWRRCDATGAGCAAIAGATAASYTLAAADVGHTLRVAVTASNSAGSATAVSAATGVVSAAGSEGSFGQSLVGSLIDGGGAGYLDLSGPYTVGSAVSVSRLSGYMAGGSAASRMRGLIYADSGGQPNALMAVSAEVSLAAGAAATWVSLPFTSAVALPAGSYWLGYWYADANARRYYTDTTGAERYKAATYSATGSPPATFGTASTSTSSYALIAVYPLP